MNKEIFVITIIDPDNSVRRDVLISVFQTIASIQLVCYDQANKGYVCQRMDGKDTSIPDITFIHAGDYKKIIKNNKKREYGTIENTVFYGGGGGKDSRIPSESKECIYRTMSTESSNLSEEEAKELLEYFNLPPNQRNDDTRPDILLQPKTLEILPSLSILCQGYLAVHASKDGHDSDCGDSDCKMALEKMGWGEFVSTGIGVSLIRYDIGEEKDINVVDKSKDRRWSNWWRDDIFEDQEWEELKEAITRECDSKENKCKDYNDVPVSIRKIFDAIEAPAQEIDLGIVAKAYCEINDQLGKP